MSYRYELFIKLKPSEMKLFTLIGHFSKVIERNFPFSIKNNDCREGYVHFIVAAEQFGVHFMTTQQLYMKGLNQESFLKQVEFDCPGERCPEQDWLTVVCETKWNKTK